MVYTLNVKIRAVSCKHYWPYFAHISVYSSGISWRPCGVGGEYRAKPVAPVAYQVILEPGIGQFREFEPLLE